MSVQNNNQYLTKNIFKTMIGSTDTQDDDKYLQYVFSANQMVQSAIFRYIDTPLEEGSIYWSRCRNAALAYARRLHAQDIELIEKADNYLKSYNVQLYGADGTESIPMAGGLIQELIATRTNRTETVLANYDPRLWKVVLPSQLDLASSERYQ